MSVATIQDRELLVIVPEGSPEEEWHEARDAGVTASEIHDIARGSRKAWRTILDAKLNGSTFRGNKYTEAGHEAEGRIIEKLRTLFGVVCIGRSGALFGNPDAPLHRATPDGFGIEEHLGDFGVEVKWHTEKWARTDIPAGHLDQVQWGMHVTGLAWWLYAWTVDGSDEVHHQWVPRDDVRIEQLIRQADAFLAWRAAGAPEIDDIPDDIDDHIATYAEQQQIESAAKKAKEAAGTAIKKWAGSQPAEPGDPLRKSGSRASLFFEPKPETVVLDADAWKVAEPESHAEYLELKERVAAAETAALALYSKPKTTAPTFRITANGTAA